MEKKSFFKERTGTQIKKLKRIEVANVEELIDAHIHSLPDEHVQVMNPMFPEKYSARTFNKYGPIIRLRSFNSVHECLEKKIHPWRMIKDAVDSIEGQTLGYAIIPPPRFLDDLRPFIIPWLEIFEGARVFAYSHQEKSTGIDIDISGEKKTISGLILSGSIPSRRKKIPRHNISIQGVPSTPIRKNLAKRIEEWQYYIPLRMRPFSSDLHKRRYMQFKRSFPSLKDIRVLPGMWAEVALYFEYIRQDAEKTREHFERYPNMQQFEPPSYEFRPFPLVTKFAVDLYKKIRNNSVNHKGIKFRDVEINLSIGELARQYHFENIFFAKDKRDGKLQDYDWKIENQTK